MIELPDGLRLRRAQPDDAALLARAQQAAWAATYRGIYPDERIDAYDYEAHTARWRARIEDARQEVYLILDGADCAGYWNWGAPRHGAYRDLTVCLNALYLLPPYQHRGIGRTIFDWLHRQARARGARGFFCGCSLYNLPARRFYEKMGGTVGRIDGGHECRAEDQLYFEFYTGEPK